MNKYILNMNENIVKCNNHIYFDKFIHDLIKYKYIQLTTMCSYIYEVKSFQKFTLKTF